MTATTARPEASTSSPSSGPLLVAVWVFVGVTDMAGAALGRLP
jgi:hypothetical protein